MHGIPSIGVNMHIDGTEEWEDEEADIVRENCIDVDCLRASGYSHSAGCP